MKKLSLLLSCAALAAIPALAQTAPQTSPQTPLDRPAKAPSKKPSMPADSQPSATSSANRVTSPDATWAMKVAQGGLAEVKLGQLAADHASSQAVKAFGKTMVDDHTKANDELKQIATKKGIMVPVEIGSKNQATYDRLSKLNGAAFDRAYMADMLKDHKADIAEFKREATSGTDPELKEFVHRTLPTLQRHLEMAQAAQSKSGKSAK
jgi:putative membrane protein